MFNKRDDLGFNDKKFMIISILVISFILFPVLSGVDIKSYYRHFPAEFPEGIILTAFFWIFYRYVIIELRQRYPKIEDTKRRLIILTVFTMITSPVIGHLISGAIHVIISSFGLKDCLHMGFFREVIVTYLLSFSIFATYEAIYFFVKYKDAIQDKERLQTVHVQSELDNLRNQINPHFLFNSLNTLMNIIPQDPERAMTYLSKLSKFYRYSVGKHEESLVPVQEEIENAKLYSELLIERFGTNISINVDINDNHNKKVVPLSLQLLIENAVKHNIVSKKKPLAIDVYVSDDGEFIHVKNNLQKKIQEVKSTGVGLENITRRFAFFTDKKVETNCTDEVFEVAIPLI